MKNLLIILFILLSIHSNAQLDTIPNAGFEYWDNNKPGHAIPAPWDNKYSNFIFFVFYWPPNNPQKPYKDSVTVLLNSPDTSDVNYIEQEFVLNSRPKSLCMMAGYWNHNPKEMYNVQILLWKMNNGKHDTIAFNDEDSDPKFYNGTRPVKPYIFGFPLKYRSNESPDYCYIRINMWSKRDKNKVPNTALYIDDVRFLDTLFENGVYHPDTSTIDTNKQTGLTPLYKKLETFHLYPNPSTGSFIISNIVETNLKLILYDLSGKIIYETTTNKQSTFEVNVQHLAQGVYFIRVGDEVQKLLIE